MFKIVGKPSSQTRPRNATMKLFKTLLAVSVVAAAGHASATCYNTTGSLNAISTVGATVTPSLYVHAGSTSYSTSAAVWPTFTGSVCIDTSSSPATVTGTFANFAQYSTSIKAGIAGTAVANQPNLVYAFFSSGGGTTTWTPTSGSQGTFTLGQTLTMTGGNSQTSDASLQNTGSAGTCTGSSLICNGQSTWFLGQPNLEKFYMNVSITLDAMTGKYRISGTAIGADTGGSVLGGKTGDTWYSWSISGVEI